MFSLKKMVLAGGLLLGAVFATSGSDAQAGGFGVRHGGFGHCYRPPICRPVYTGCYDPYPCYRVPVYRPICRPVFVPQCHSVYPWGY